MARIASALIAFLLLCAPASAQDTRPNIILVLTDDQTTQSFTYMPFLQSIKSQGRVFQNYFHSLALCCPSRTSILTGMYPHNHGILNNNPPHGGHLRYVELNLAQKSWGKLLQDSGYYTAWLGKFLNGYGNPLQGSDVIPAGWSWWWALYNFTDDISPFDYQANRNGELLRFAGGDKAYVTNRIKSQALNLIDRQAEFNAPFAMVVAPHCPHLPATPAKLYAGTYANKQFYHARKPNFNESDVSDKPAHIRAMPLLTQTEINLIADSWRRSLECGRSTDDALAEIWSKLTEVGQLDNTYIFITTDNGLMRGEHRIPGGKVVAYRESIQSQLFVFGPGITPGIEKQIVGNIDLMPTFAEIAELLIPAWVDGRSLFPRFVPEDASTWRKSFLVRGGPNSEKQGGRLDTSGRHFLTLVSMGYDYTKYANSPEREYYDSATDPYQLENAAGSLTPEFRAAIEQRIDELFACAGATCRQADLEPAPVPAASLTARPERPMQRAIP